MEPPDTSFLMLTTSLHLEDATIQMLAYHAKSKEMCQLWVIEGDIAIFELGPLICTEFFMAMLEVIEKEVSILKMNEENRCFFLPDTHHGGLWTKRKE